MKILTREQIVACDAATIAEEKIISIHLMERAAISCRDWVLEKYENFESVLVFCGNGNNGGDGFALARLLHQKGWQVQVLVDKDVENYSPDALSNYQLLGSFSKINVKDYSEFNPEDLTSKTLLVDALYGTGLSRPLVGKVKELVEKVNSVSACKVSIDIPSGLYCDAPLGENDVVFLSDDVLTFQSWKKSFFHPESRETIGKITVLDIQLSKNYLDQIKDCDEGIDDTFVQSIYKKRAQFSHKGTFGKAFIYSGSYGKMGAAVLASKSSIAVGSGTTTMGIPASGNTILQISCPEAMTIDAGDRTISHMSYEDEFTYGIGPGIGVEPETKAAVLEFISNATKPIVVDADALNIISSEKEGLAKLPKNSIITPHPKEFERLFGKTEDSYKRVELASRKAKELGLIIVLKDRYTQVCLPSGKICYNTTGNAGLAKGGSGDVLLGCITSLLAQGYSPENAALLSVWLHGKAGDFASLVKSQESNSASQIIENFGNAFIYINEINSLVR